MSVDLPAEEGVVIIELLPNSPAVDAGLRPLDVITKVDDEKVTNMSNLRKILYKYRIGQKAILTINRNGEIIKVPIKFKEF